MREKRYIETAFRYLRNEIIDYLKACDIPFSLDVENDGKLVYYSFTVFVTKQEEQRFKEWFAKRVFRERRN